MAARILRRDTENRCSPPNPTQREQLHGRSQDDDAQTRR
jgi:hypothetical protein